MKTSQGSGTTGKGIMLKVVFLILFFNGASALSFNPWNWRNPSTKTQEGPEQPTAAPEILDPASNNYLRSPYKPCSTGTKGFMKKVDVIPCEGSSRCPLVRGQNVTLDLEFSSTIAAKSVIGSLYGVLGGPFPVSIKFGKPENLCTSNQIECPLVPWKVYSFKITVFIKPSYPKFKLDTKVLIQSDDGQDIACALIPVEITNPTP